MKRLAALLCLLSAPAFAQGNPAVFTGQIPSAAQWNSYFAAKADVTSGTLNSPTLNNPTFNGTVNIPSATISGSLTGNSLSLSGAGTALSVTNAASVGGGQTFGANSTVKGVWAGGAGSASLTLTGGTNPTLVLTSGAGDLARFVGAQSASLVNTWFIESSATGSPANLILAGGSSDTNTSAQFQVKGSGSFKFMNTIGTLAQTIVGTATIGNGTTRTFSGTADYNNASVLVKNVLAGTGTDIQQPLAVIWVPTDAVAQANQNIADLVINHSMTAGSSGNRIGIDIQMSAAATPLTPTAQLLPFRGTGVANVNLGGTNLTSLNSSGVSWGANFVASAAGTATNLAGVIAQELNVSIGGTATARRKGGLQIIKVIGDTTQGLADLDTALDLSDQNLSPEVPWNTGLRFGLLDGQWPFDSTSSLIKASTSHTYATVATTAGFGVDFLEATFTNYAWRSLNASIDGAGVLQIGTGLVKQIAAGLAVDVAGSVATAAAVAAGGAGYLAGDVFYFGNGGRGHVVTVAAGVVTVIAIDTYPFGNSSSTPANSIATTVWAINSAASGLTLNLTWNTTANQLSLNPSGGNTVIGTGSALATNATAGFVQLATMAGSPSGTVGAAGKAAVVIDTTNKKICYSTGGGTWECSGAFTP